MAEDDDGKRRLPIVTITNSELSDFRTCRQRHWFKHVELLRPKTRARPLAVGDCVHAGLAAMYRHIGAAQRAAGALVHIDVDELVLVALAGMEDRFDTYRDRWMVQLEATPDAAERVFEDARKTKTEAEGAVERFVRKLAAYDAEQYWVIAVERPFEVPLLNAAGHRRPRTVNAGVQDMLLYDPEYHTLVLGEHKTTSGSAHDAERRLDMDPQTSGYLYVARLLAEAGELYQPPGAPTMQTVTTGRIFYNVVRKRGPAQPELTQKGMVSAALIDTTREVYEAALVEQESRGIPRTDKQVERLVSLSTYERYVRRHETFTSKAQVERWREETVTDANLIRQARAGKLMPTRNAEACNPPWAPACPFRSICIEDSPEVRAAEFEVAQRHNEVKEAIAEQRENEL